MIMHTAFKKMGLSKKDYRKSLTISKNPSEDQMIIGSFWFKNSKDFFDMHETSVNQKKFRK
jgi:hypothetical protein